MSKTELSRGTLFDAKIVSDLISKVQGHSSLALLSKQTPIPFNGQTEFIFSLDNEVDIVAENGQKSLGGVDLTPIKIVPIKVEYGARVSDEFMFATDEEKINILKAFNDGFAKKVARGLDIMAMHGLNPRTKEASNVVGDNHLDKATETETVTFEKGKGDENIEAAIQMVLGSGGKVSGCAMSPVLSSDLATIKVNGVRQFPEFGWGQSPSSVNGLSVDVNDTVSFGDDQKDVAIVGDFANMFKWGYAKQIPLEVIQFGDPDNSGKDLKGYNQVYLRAEVYLGWGILDKKSFARVVKA